MVEHLFLSRSSRQYEGVYLEWLLVQARRHRVGSCKSLQMELYQRLQVTSHESGQPSLNRADSQVSTHAFQHGRFHTERVVQHNLDVVDHCLRRNKLVAARHGGDTT